MQTTNEINTHMSNTLTYHSTVTLRMGTVFGMVDTYMQPAHAGVQSRDAATLHILPGTIIYSDEWSSYDCVGTLPSASLIRQLVCTLRMWM